MIPPERQPCLGDSTKCRQGWGQHGPGHCWWERDACVTLEDSGSFLKS